MYELTDILRWLNDKVIWGPPMIILLMGTGIYFSVGTKFFQLRHLCTVLKTTVGSLFSSSPKGEECGITRLQAVSTALGATIGTGNIVGVASAIALGGAGAIFWMWVSAFFGMMTAYAENLLGVCYRRKNSKGDNIGGPMYYLTDGLKDKRFLNVLRKPLAFLFAFFCLLSSLGMGNMTQVNTVSVILSSGIWGIKIPPVIIGVALSIMVAFVIFGGLNRVCTLAEKTVPLMAVLYILGCFLVIIINITALPSALKEIFCGAFCLPSFLGGGTGYVIKKSVEMGLRRGVFSNEAGLGSSVIVGAASSVTDPVEQGMWGIFTVFFDTIIGCSLTAFALLLGGVNNSVTGDMGAVAVSIAFKNSLGTFAGQAVAAFTVFFALSTILGWSFYGIRCAEFLFGEGKTLIYKLLFVWAVIPGALLKLDTVWLISDAFNGLMAVPNLIGVLALSGRVIAITGDYCYKHSQST